MDCCVCRAVRPGRCEVVDWLWGCCCANVATRQSLYVSAPTPLIHELTISRHAFFLSCVNAGTFAGRVSSVCSTHVGLVTRIAVQTVVVRTVVRVVVYVVP